jgi:predicted RNA methylase
VASFTAFMTLFSLFLTWSRAPTDEKHIEGIDISHHIALMLMDEKLTLAPLKSDIQNVLDVGTGTGIWAMFVIPLLILHANTYSRQ